MNYRNVELDYSKQLINKFINISDVTVEGTVYIELEGQDGGNSYPFSITNTDGTVQTFVVPQSFKGELKTWSVSISTANINEGQFFCIAEIYRGNYTLSKPIDSLYSEYVTSQKFVGFPFSQLKSPQDTVGNLISIPNVMGINSNTLSFTNTKNRLLNLISLQSKTEIDILDTGFFQYIVISDGTNYTERTLTNNTPVVGTDGTYLFTLVTKNTINSKTNILVPSTHIYIHCNLKEVYLKKDWGLSIENVGSTTSNNFVDGDNNMLIFTEKIYI
jgi:hypothetical protein